MSRRLLLAIAAMGIAQAAVYVVRPATSYRLLGLGSGAGDVGLVTAAFALVPLFLAIPLGRVADRMRSGPLLVGGCALQAASAFALAAAETTTGIALATALLGVGHLGLALGVQHVIARESEHRQHDHRFAVLTVAVSAGQLVGPLLAGLLIGETARASLATASGRAMLVAGGIASVATLAAAAASLGEGPPPSHGQRSQRRRVGEIVRIPGIPSGVFASAAVLSSADVITAYLPLLGERRGLGPTVVGVLLAVRAGASVAARVGVGPLVRRFGRLELLAASAAAAAAALVALTFTGDALVLGLLIAVAGYGLGFGQPLSMTMVVQRVPADSAATALAVRLTGNRLGQVVAPAVAGAIAGGAGIAAVFWLLGATLAVSALAVQRLAAAGGDSAPG